MLCNETEWHGQYRTMLTLYPLTLQYSSGNGFLTPDECYPTLVTDLVPDIIPHLTSDYSRAEELLEELSASFFDSEVRCVSVACETKCPPSHFLANHCPSCDHTTPPLLPF